MATPSTLKRPRSEEATRATPEPSPIVRLNVGGTAFTTLRGTLCNAPGSMLSAKFAEGSPFGAPLTDETGTFFLDTNPETSGYILDYLRRGSRLAGKPPVDLLERVRADADYFGISELVAELDKRLAKANATPRYEYEHKALRPMTWTDENAKEQRETKARRVDESRQQSRLQRLARGARVRRRPGDVPRLRYGETGQLRRRTASLACVST